MRASPRTYLDVLKDKRGASTSMIEALGAMSMKTVATVVGGGLFSAVLIFWAVSTASATASSGFQASDLGFDKAVGASNVVVGADGNRVGLMKDVVGGKCEVQTWQNGSRDGATTLHVDTKTVAGVCSPATALIAAGGGTKSVELIFDIETPAFTYSNLGGREIAFDAAGSATLAAAAKPDDVRLVDWEDVRPYKVELKLEALDEDTAKVTKKAVLSGFTNVVNVTVAEDDLRYVPSPSDDPIPGPLRVTDVSRSTTTGAVFAGAREGVAITVGGGVCPTGPTKLTASYTQQSPTAKPAVSTVFSSVLTGADTTLHLGSVANGATGLVSASATCMDGGAVEKAETIYTQAVPATVLTVKQNAAAEKHDLSWVAVSSLPTSFEVSWQVGGKSKGVLTTTTALAAQSVNTPGANYGLTSEYTIIATVDTIKSPPATASISNPVPAPAATAVTSSASGASWAAVTCVAGTTPQYASRYHQQTGTNTGVNWTAMSAWGTGRTLTGVTTPAYGRTVTEVQARCVSTASGMASVASKAGSDAFYQPEAINVSAGRSTTQGTVFQGAREGMLAWHSGARCYNGSSSKIDLSWQPVTPTGQSNVNNSRTLVPTGSGQSVELGNVKNGAQGNLVGTVTCTAGKSGSATKSAAFTQTLPAPGLSIAQTSAHQHKLTWNQVSSLPTSFEVQWSSSNKAISGTVTNTTALTYTATQTTGSTYGQTSYYSVIPKVGNQSNSSQNNTFTAWPATSPATNLSTSITNVSSRKLNWSAGGACPAGTNKQTRSNLNLKWSWDAVGIWKDYEVSGWTNNKTSDNSSTAIDQGYPFQFAVEARCANAYGQSTPVSVQSANQWNGWNTPAAPTYNAYTNWQKTEQPAGSIYDICRNHGTSTCSVSNYGNSIQLQYRTFCPGGSTMDASNVHSRSWAGGEFDQALNTWDGWETGRVDQHVYYLNALYDCKTPWGNKSPTSPRSGEQAVLVRGR